MFNSQEGAAYVYGVRAVPEGAGHVPDRVTVRFIGNTGVGAENVYGLLEVRDGLGYGGLNRGFRTDVALKAKEVVVGLVESERVGADIVSADFAALCCKRVRTEWVDVT